MRRALLVVFVALAFAAGLAARFPLSAALAVSGVRDAGLEWRKAEGTIWSGKIRGVDIQGYHLGDVHAALSPLSLLTVSPRIAATLSGPEADARASLAFGLRQTRIAAGAAHLRLSEIMAIDPRLRMRGGALTADDVEVILRDGRCISASGALASNALTFGLGGDWRGPLLAGTLSCEDGVIVMRLAGADEAQQIAATARLGGGAYTIDANVDSQDPALVRIAPLIGFTEYGEGWRYRWTFAQ